MTRRRAEIALLASSLVDVSVVTSTWRGNPLCSSGEVPRGLAPFRTVVCGRCDGRGVVADRFRREVVCEGCDGAGKFAVDGYTGERVGTAETPTVVRMRSSLCDACGGTGAGGAHLVGGVPGTERRDACGKCGGTGRVEWSPFELHGALPEGEQPREDGSGLLARPRELARLYAAGSYAELERTLATLAGMNGRAHRLWVSQHVAGLAPPVDGLAAELLERAWRFVEAAMPDPVRVPGEIRAAARRRIQPPPKGAGAGRRALRGRDDEIRRLYNTGELSVPELVRQTGLSRSQVYAVLRDDEAA